MGFLKQDDDEWFIEEQLNDEEESVDLSDMSPLEDDEEVKEGKGVSILTPNKLLTKLPILLVQKVDISQNYKCLKQ